MAKVREQVEWLNLTDVSGPFLAPAVLKEVFPQGLDEIETQRRQHLRAAYDEWRDELDNPDSDFGEIHDEWLRLVLQEALEYDGEVLVPCAKLADDVVYESPEHGATVSPDFAVRSDDGKLRLLINVYPPEVGLEKTLPGDHWTASPAERMTLLCRANEIRAGLITNGEQWMVVNAPVGNTSGYATWHARLWWQEPITFKAFVSLLGVRRCFGQADRTLDQLLERSTEFQEEITNTLGEQVRRAVEVLIQAIGRADQDRNGELLADIQPVELYEAGLTAMMRLVFILCAEERGLLLLGDPIYDQHHAIATLRTKLNEDADQYGVEVLERRHDAWSRVLTVFRVVYGGVEHESLRLPALGGSLFDPDRFPFLEGRAKGTSWRDEPATPLPIDNRTVLLLLNALQVLEQTGGAMLLSYKALDVEQIGHVYEGLLEYTAARVPEVTLGLIGTKKCPNPYATLAELESLQVEGEEPLVDRMKELTGRSLSALQKAVRSEGKEAFLGPLVQACGGNEDLARRVLPFGELVRADSWGNMLVYESGSFAIARGTARRATGTHYTPRSLTEPVVRHTLEPLVYKGPAEGKHRKNWKLKSAADILDLNVCDMACGSGAFLVEACRYLSQRLVEAWAEAEDDGRVITIDGDVLDEAEDHELLPNGVDDRLLIARRLVVQSCLYGVDKNHLAVELAKLSLWLITLAKNKPFGFLDHAIRCGDSLVGLHDLEQLRHYRLKPDADDAVLFRGPLDEAVDEAIDLRLKLESMPANTVADVESQKTLLREAEDKIARLRCAADLLVAAEFWGEKTTNKQKKVEHAAMVSSHYVENGTIEEFEEEAAKYRQGQGMFHWPLEFPEVIVKREGFDAFVGNPPFMVAFRIAPTFGPAYNSYLKNYWSHGKGRADLVAYFLLQAVELVKREGNVGLITTKTISQEDNRRISLNHIRNQGSVIYRALPNYPWPGGAAVHVSITHLHRGKWKGKYWIGERQVKGISTELVEDTGLAEPYRLAGFTVEPSKGTTVNGKGFVLEQGEARHLLDISQANADVIRPYLNGAELNKSMDGNGPRFIIDFRDWSRLRAESYREPWHIIQERVFAHRQIKRLQVHEKDFWKFSDRRPDLYESLAEIDYAIVFSLVSKYFMFSMVPAEQLFSSSLGVIPSDDWGLFAILNSCFHIEWAYRYMYSLKGDPRYSISSCYRTYPFVESSPVLAEFGVAYDSVRRRTMLEYSLGLRAMYDRFHQTDSSICAELRALHAEMDQSVTAAYGWDDLDLGHGFHQTKQGIRFTISEPARREVLQRLLKLNHKRYAVEVAQGLHDKKKGSRNSKGKKVNKRKGKSDELLF